MIKNDGCKCCIIHDPAPAADVQDLACPVASVCLSGDVPTMFDFEDPEMNTDRDNVCPEFHSTEVGWELDDLDDLDAVVTEKMMKTCSRSLLCSMQRSFSSKRMVGPIPVNHILSMSTTIELD